MDISVNFLGIKFDNPLMPASGPSVDSIRGLEFFNESMTGAVVTKTISVEGAKVGKPCITSSKGMVFNTELWSEHSLETWKTEILPTLCEKLRKPLIASVGYTSEELMQVVPQVEKFADMFEVSTHYGKDGLESLVKGIRSVTDKPVFIKLSPHIEDYISFVQTALDAGATGIVAINSLGPGMVIDLKKRAVKLGVGGGKSWVSGPAIKPVALNRIANIRMNFPDMPLIACGGAADATDVVEFILAGADMVQMLSSAFLGGRGTYDKIVEQLPQVLARYGFASIEEVRRTPLDLVPQGKGDYPQFSDKCNKCSICVDACPMLALGLNDTVTVDRNLCIRCGLCESRCPKGAISGLF